MIGTIKIQLNAAHPNLALQPLYAFVGSPSNLRIIDVPKKIGNWHITDVYVSYNYPDNTQQTLPCTLVGGAYVCTLPASTAVGTSGLGYSVIANGVDENENPVNGYVLGKGDIVILDIEAAISTGAKANYVNLLSAQREVPEDGDMWQTADGGYVIWQDGEVHELNVPFEAISAYVESQVSSKADEDELTAYATIDSLSVYASEEWVESQIGDVMNQLDAKANEDEVNAELSVKADKDYVDAINSEITIRIDNVVNNMSDKADKSELTDYATTSSLSSYYTKSETSSANEISTALTEYVTSAQVTPYSGGFYQGYAEKSVYSGYLYGYSNAGTTVPPNSLLIFAFVGGMPIIQIRDYAPWTLTKWDGADLAEPVTMNFNYYGNIYIKKGSRVMQVYVNSYAWVGGIGTPAAYIIKAEEDENGGFQPTGIAKKSSAGNTTYLDLTLTTNYLSVETVDGQEGLVECTRTRWLPTASTRYFMYSDEISAQLSTKADVAVESDVAQLSAQTAGSAFPMTFGLGPDLDGYVQLSDIMENAVNGVAFCEIDTDTIDEHVAPFTITDGTSSEAVDRTLFYYKQQTSTGSITISDSVVNPVYRVTVARSGSMQPMCFIEQMGASSV